MKTEILENHIKLMGYKATDKVTGFTGVIDSVCFDLYGCIQASLTPPQDSGKEWVSSRWFDITRLEVSGDRVMKLPAFDRGYVAEGNKGPADKPHR